jgi:molybdate transport system substrate-binding protein
MPFRAALALACGAFLAAAMPAAAAEVRVAVAANFEPALQALAPRFTARSGHRLAISAGSSGKLATQIQQGAPFDVFLSADAERPALLVERGLAVAGSTFVYARGRLVLWSARERLSLGAHTLRNGVFDHLAIANPEAAPYGVAALETLDRLGVRAALEPKLVRGESIGQTYAFVASGAAEVGLVALAQLADGKAGSRWLVPAELHGPIEQHAALLSRAREAPGPLAFVQWLQSSEARQLIAGFGYELP